MRDLQERNPEVRFVVVLPKGGRYFSQYEAFCEAVYEFDYSINSTMFRNGKKLRRIVESSQPDVIHSWFTQTTLYMRLFLRSFDIPKVFQVVGPLHLEKKLFKYADVFSAGKNEYWIATSQYIYDTYRKAGISNERLFLTYAYIDALQLKEKGKTLSPIHYHTKYQLPSETKIIGTASYIYPPKFYEKNGVKGHEYLIQAFEKLLEVRQDVRLVIAGELFGVDKSYLTELKEMANRKCGDKVIFTGRYENVYEVISGFDLFVYLSTSENLGGVYESLLFEVPTLASNSGALPELVVNGETGYTVPFGDIELIAEKIQYMLERPDELDRMKTNGSKRVLSFFDKESLLNNAIEVYRKIIADPMN